MGVDLGNGLILHAPAQTGTPLYALNTSKVVVQIAGNSLKFFSSCTLTDVELMFSLFLFRLPKYLQKY